MDRATRTNSLHTAGGSSSRPPEISSIKRNDEEGGMGVEFNGSKSFEVPYTFIRDSCPTCFDPRTGLRVFSVSSITGNLKIQDAGIVKGNGINRLRVEWCDGTISELESAWLYLKCISDRADSGLDEFREPPMRLWGSDLTNTLPTFQYKTLTSDSMLQYSMLQSLIYKEGVVLIRSAPNRASLLKQVCDGILRGELRLNLAAVKGNGGRPERRSGRVYAAPESGWRGRPIHSERAYCEGDSGFVALMCTKQPEKGGNFMLVDGYNLEQRMKEESVEHHRTLSSAVVLYAHGADHSAELRAARTVFALDRTGKVQMVAFDEQHRMRWEGGPCAGGRFLCAWRALANMAYRPELVTAQSLQPGDVLVLDARRVLWGQAPWKGGAQACGIEKEFVERNQILSRYRSIQNSGLEAELTENQPQPASPTPPHRPSQPQSGPRNLNCDSPMPVPRPQADSGLNKSDSPIGAEPGS